MSTAETHTKIHELAASFIEYAERLENDPDAYIALHERYGRLIEPDNDAMLDMAASLAYAHGKVSVQEFERGKHMAVAQATTLTALDPDGVDYRWCQHRPAGFADLTGASIVSPAMKYAGCPQCVSRRARSVAELLKLDESCDVCGERSEMLQPLVRTIGSVMVSLFVGDCCIELITYLEPVSTMTITRVGRNEPCPCGSTRKFKRCCGRPS